jgi:hypothetical protein
MVFVQIGQHRHEQQTGERKPQRHIHPIAGMANGTASHARLQKVPAGSGGRFFQDKRERR